MSGATVNLFAQVQSSQPGENILLSPTSIDFALGMTENGAAGETLSQMEETVNGGLSVDTINPIMKHLSNRYMNAAEVEWNIANSIWFKNDGQVAMGD